MSQLTRRRFLQTSLAAAPLVALAPTVPAFLVNAARAGNNKPSGRILVVVELAGGNDGINTKGRITRRLILRYVEMS